MKLHVNMLIVSWEFDEGLISETLIDMYSKVGTIAEPAGAASVAALEVIKDEIKEKPSSASFQW